MVRVKIGVEVGEGGERDGIEEGGERGGIEEGGERDGMEEGGEGGEINDSIVRLIG